MIGRSEPYDASWSMFLFKSVAAASKLIGLSSDVDLKSYPTVSMRALGTEFGSIFSSDNRLIFVSRWPPTSGATIGVLIFSEAPVEMNFPIPFSFSFSVKFSVPSSNVSFVFPFDSGNEN